MLFMNNKEPHFINSTSKESQHEQQNIKQGNKQ